MKVFCFILFAVMMVLAMFGNVVCAGNKQEGERCRRNNECADGLTCERIINHPTAVLVRICKKS